MLFRNYTYTPAPAREDVRLTCVIVKSPTDTFNTEYQINSQHRDRNPNKSQWAVSCEEEVSMFAGTAADGIITDEQYMWGLFIPEREPVALGVTKNGDTSRIALFDNGKHNGFWHGYPADYIRGRDVPSDEVFDLWREKGIFEKPDIKKIVKGQW